MQWWKMPYHQLYSHEQSHLEADLAPAQSQGLISKLNGVQYFSTLAL